MRMKISYRGYRFPVGIIANLQLAEPLYRADTYLVCNSKVCA
jgi:hypothetical protein